MKVCCVFVSVCLSRSSIEGEGETDGYRWVSRGFMGFVVLWCGSVLLVGDEGLMLFVG